ncbi:MAG: GNAT family N-acetyltransferase [Roseobacter sp.]
MTDVSVHIAQFPRDMDALTRLCWAYRAHLATLTEDVAGAIDRFYPADSYDDMIVQLPQKHARPKGSILLAWQGDTAIGCGMIQRLSDADAEIKRVYIQKGVQGLGAGKRMSQALIDQARSDSYRRILLDTTRVSMPARRLYESLGFVARGPYMDFPKDILDAFVFYELTL